ncbi:MAG: plasmid pRiA4b ORF-3 family protein [Deltaproteobacteria bacterium]|nr:plasmid pRiA4b ORF-3 family protein [Deltaproteobacteria bacterium]
MAAGTRSRTTSAVYQLKVTLKGSKPPIWRRFQVAADTTLGDLHPILQRIMGWDDSHLHHFRLGLELFGVPDPDDTFGDDVEDERDALLRDVLPAEKAKLRYEYDFGDSWDHELILEKILPPEPAAELPRCLTGKRACPPEDCGGLWGYAELLDALSDPRHPEHEEQLEWLGEGFDPEAFDLQAVNAALRALALGQR